MPIYNGQLMMRTFRIPYALTVTLALIAVAATGVSLVAGQQRPADTESLEIVQVRPNFYVIVGDGSNIAVQLGTDGIVIVDTGTGEKAKAGCRRDPQAVDPADSLCDQHQRRPGPRWRQRRIVGGGPVGDSDRRPQRDWRCRGTRPILAEENVQSRMTAPEGEKSAFPIGAWPTVTYSAALEEMQKDLYINGEAIITSYQPAAHTDGDSIVFFRRSDVLVTGDVFDQTRFPVIDREKGGSIQGVIDSLNRIIGITVPPIPFVWQEGGTVVVPGHGLISHEADVVDYRDMVTIVRDRIQAWIGKEMTLDQVRKADPVKGFRGRYGSDKGAWTTDKFIEAVYRDLGGK